MAAEAARPGMVKVRLTLSEEPFEVHESELPSLRAQGLLVEEKPEAQPVPKQPPPGGTPPAT